MLDSPQCRLIIDPAGSSGPSGTDWVCYVGWTVVFWMVHLPATAVDTVRATGIGRDVHLHANAIGTRMFPFLVRASAIHVATWTIVCYVSKNTFKV